MIGWSQSGWSQLEAGSGGGSGAYVGPMDVTGWSSAFEYHGLRAKNATYAATLGPLADFEALLGSTVVSTYTLNSLSNGSPNTAGLITWRSNSISSGATVFQATKIYGQNGLFDLVTPSGVHRGPVLELNGQKSGTLPTLWFDPGGISSYLQSSVSPGAHSMPWTVGWTSNVSSTQGTPIWIQHPSTSFININVSDYINSLGFMRLEGNVNHVDLAIAANAGDYRSTFVVADNASSKYQQDGTEVSPSGAFDTIAITAGSTVSIGAGGLDALGGHFNYINSRNFEWIWIDGAVSKAYRDLLRTNQQTFGIVL